MKIFYELTVTEDEREDLLLYSYIHVDSMMHSLVPAQWATVSYLHHFYLYTMIVYLLPVTCVVNDCVTWHRKKNIT